ncbi:hypothetical protein [Streptomyces sp. SID5910]|uniref:hypothetical protein n=1 Tax=Streptomyces sp. SID5910 TaxID=2690312 RepID=UPI00136EC0D5|nr:hypothetical protein [Streptomyces sp. SID5910]MYR45070.1 hypothetical protein [Streptomyces sp. SID5910]
MITVAAEVSQYTTGTVTTAGFALGLALLAAEHWRWYKTGGGAAAAAGRGAAPAATNSRNPKALIPYWFGITCGILAVACPAGLLGTGTSVLRWGGNGVGGWIMSTMTGQRASTMASAAAPGLNSYGAIVVTALVIALWTLRKNIAKAVKGKWWKGVFTGALLCISTGTAAFIAVQVVGGANGLGEFVLQGAATWSPV